MNHRGLRPAFNRTLYLAFGTPFGQFATMITLGLACASIFVVNPPEPDEDEDDDEEEEDPSLEEVVKRISPFLHQKLYSDAADDEGLDGDDQDPNWK